MLLRFIPKCNLLSEQPHITMELNMLICLSVNLFLTVIMPKYLDLEISRFVLELNFNL